MPRPRDEMGRFLPAPKTPKPWGILATDRHSLGADRRALNRRKGRITARTEKTTARFATREEAEAHIATLERNKRWRFTAAEF